MDVNSYQLACSVYVPSLEVDQYIHDLMIAYINEVLGDECIEPHVLGTQPDCAGYVPPPRFPSRIIVRVSAGPSQGLSVARRCGARAWSAYGYCRTQFFRKVSADSGVASAD